ncbi:MAG: NUDIX hydrolase [Candidatus Dormibacteria bacterium]|jgi:ADP-ribose pyrophosphatase YjhB (NUDIX family)
MEPRVRVAVCLTAADRLLLVAHRKGAHRYWLLPGGGVEMGETLVEATRREVREETGLEAEIGRLLIVCDAIEPGGRHLVNLVFAATVAVGRPPGGLGVVTSSGAGVNPALDPAIDQVRWVSRDELLGLELHPPIAGAVAAAWAGGFAGEVQVLGNVWVADPSRPEGRTEPAGR